MFGTLFKCARTDNTCLSLFYPCWWCLKIFWYYLNRLDFSFCGMYLPRHRETNYSLIDNVSGWQLMSLNWNQQRAWNWSPIKSRALTHISLSHPGLQGLLILCWDTQAISKKIIMATVTEAFRVQISCLKLFYFVWLIYRLPQKTELHAWLLGCFLSF